MRTNALVRQAAFAKHLRTFRLFGGGLALLAVGGTLVAEHDVADEGLAASDITPAMLAEAQQAVASGEAEGWHTGAYLLDFEDAEEGASQSDVAQAVAALDARDDLSLTLAGPYSETEHLYRLQATPEAFAAIEHELREHDLIEGIEPEFFYTLPDTAFAASSNTAPDDGADLNPRLSEAEIDKPSRFQPNDPMFGLQWHMEQIYAPEAWVLQRGKGAVVAVVDTGIAWKDGHGVKALPDLAGIEFVAGESFVSGVPEGLDDHAHGSHVAGTIAQATDNGVGVTGVAHQAKLMPLKVLSRDGRGSTAGIANAIRYAADHGAHVVNMSLGGPLPSKVLAKAIEYAHEKGVTVVCAAGNERRSRVGYPAANKHAVAVSSTAYDRSAAWYSNWGKDIDIAAPGGDTRADLNGDGHPDGVLQNTIMIQRPAENDYLWFQGTSMASPHAAGVAALVVATGVTNPDEVERIMKETADHPGGAAWDERFGAGIVNAHKAVVTARTHYAPERGALVGLLALLGLGGLMSAGSRRSRMVTLGGTVVGAVVASGAAGFFSPVAYGIAQTATAFGIGAFGSPLVFSAALPLLATLLLLGVRPLRGLLAGVSLGYAALLLHGALVLPTLLTDLPGGPMVDRLWLAANAVLALWLTHKIARTRSAS